MKKKSTTILQLKNLFLLSQSMFYKCTICSGDLVSEIRKEGLDVVDSEHGLLSVVPQVDGLISGCFVIIVHPIISFTTGDPHTA